MFAMVRYVAVRAPGTSFTDTFIKGIFPDERDTPAQLSTGANVYSAR